MNIPWIEKYRPQNLDDLMLDDITMSKIKGFLREGNIPNIIITGVPGIGKTSTILCIARLLLGKYFNDGLLELNASDDRGIKAVQECIINFCKKKIEGITGNKIILLDEADNMTDKAQMLISNIMEEYSNTTRFAFTCNNSVDIIKSIQSRCIILRYPRINKNLLKQRLLNICKLEKVKFDEEGIDRIIYISQGDLRQAVNNLQVVHEGIGVLNKKNIMLVSDLPTPEEISDILCKGTLRDKMNKLSELLKKGYSANDISLGMIQVLKSKDLKISEEDKLIYIAEIGNTCIAINRGVGTQLQLNACLARIYEKIDT